MDKKQMNKLSILAILMMVVGMVMFVGVMFLKSVLIKNMNDILALVLFFAGAILALVGCYLNLICKIKKQRNYKKEVRHLESALSEERDKKINYMNLYSNERRKNLKSKCVDSITNSKELRDYIEKNNKVLTGKKICVSCCDDCFDDDDELCDWCHCMLYLETEDGELLPDWISGEKYM